nr:uncharacterized protein LOC107456310 [Parasteatoda tepidariorum]
MPWCIHWLYFIFFLSIQHCVLALEEISNSKPIPLWSSLHSNFKREVKENSTSQNFTVTSNADVKVISETDTLHDLPNNSSISDTYNSTHNVPSWMVPIKSGALQRTGFVVLGFMIIILLFFVVRSVRMHHKKSKSRKYGVITSTDMEMVPLDNDDEEEEEMTLFDVKQKFLK